MMARFLTARFLATLFFTAVACGAIELSAKADTVDRASFHHEQVAAAIAALDAADMDSHWQFTMNIALDEELRVVSHDPLRSDYDVRRLVSVDDAAPSEKQLKKFREEEKKRLDERDPDTARYSYLVDLDSLQLENTGSDTLTFSFAPKVVQFEDAADQLRGNLVLNAATGQVEQISITNTGELSPAFSVTVAHYLLALNFVDVENARLLSSMTSEVRGKAGFLKSFDVNTQVAFSDYKLVVAD